MLVLVEGAGFLPTERWPQRIIMYCWFGVSHQFFIYQNLLTRDRENAESSSLSHTNEAISYQTCQSSILMQARQYLNLGAFIVLQ